ncbi:MAG TPA: UDP-N-acetylmuramoyl-L-alanine--D-glutamate ligase, partial [Burkholderiales bacterium]|nr:UDP-N-acetylmuramoyl-L-alanine--D-glutamate ligase [Burkholderiales bacterium]
MLDGATVLNISEDHLDRYRDLLEYAYAKSNIFNNCKSQVLNANDVFTLAMKRSKQEQIYFGIENCEFCLKMVDKETYLQIGSKPFLKVKDLQLMGQHNYLNCLASLALLQAAGIKVEDNKVKAALSNFKGIEHRMQKVLEHNEIIFIEDSKGTNVGAVVAGVSGLDMPIHLILGGDGKGQDFAPLRDLVLKKCKSVAIIGQDKKIINKVLQELSIPVQCFNLLQEAVKFSISNAKAGEAVVLSPACASWDMFSNYKERAQVFIDSIYENIK